MTSLAAELRSITARLNRELLAIMADLAEPPTLDERSLGKLISEERGKAGWTLDQLAERAGLSKAHIWELEKGNAKNPTARTCVGLARAFGMPIETVVFAAIRTDTQNADDT